MRASRLLIFVITLTGLSYGCKTSTSTTRGTTDAYREDLSVLRPDLKVINADTSEVDSSKAMSATEPIRGHIKYELDSVNRIIIAQNKVRKYVDGFTIQVYTGSDRDKAYAAVGKVKELNPDLNPTIGYYQPSYKVKVGQYISKLEAHQIYESLRSEFPLALLIPERIPVDYD